MRRLGRLVYMVYKSGISPLLHSISGGGAGCRFYPTCGDYAAKVFATQPPLKALWLSTKRVCRCHPFAAGGVDLPPDSA